MKFYRRIGQIKAISFDLDDTLYSNRPVMVATEQAMLAYFKQHLSPLLSNPPAAFDRNFWRPFRHAAINDNVQLKHDVTALRLDTYTRGIFALCHDNIRAKQMAQQAFDFFMAKRSDFTVPESSKALLAKLRTKMPVVAISNGNVDTDAIGLTSYFDAIYHAGNGLAKKPHIDMFQAASNNINVPLKHILHVGDCGFADITGALRAGMQTAWLSCYDVGRPIKTLPHIELTAVEQLEHII
ncbi:HAD-IA family hydrolase [Thalassotalea euphylliae]|uniref:HAD-IA family hydrolase n=1 Tax=Thalassotalea euphylliae TaxID=1655234 RepID=UPI00362570A5